MVCSHRDMNPRVPRSFLDVMVSGEQCVLCALKSLSLTLVHPVFILVFHYHV